MSSIESDRERLSQSKMLTWLSRDIAMTEMVTVYSSDGIYCALIPVSKVENCLDDISWDFYHGWGMPGAVEYYEGKDKRVEYLRFGDDRGIEPLIIDRDFYGIREDYVEICEEFRLFHRLYHDRKQDRYFKYDDSGNEHLIAIVEPNRVQIRLKEIRQFLAIKEMYLSIQFDCREHSEYTPEALGLKEGGVENRRDLFCCSLFYGDLRCPGTDRAFSRLLGKRLIPPLAKEKSGFWGFAEKEPKQHIDFIIDVDENGENVTYSSDPSGLSNRYFDKNPTTPDYLTPVFFKKEVLDKYYQQPDKYSVEDGYLRCCGLWGITMDNHHADKVVMWLGDLGRDLPYEEKLHWKSFNIQPIGGVSSTFFKRQICAIATDTNQPDILFKHEYAELLKFSQEKLGWPLLLPLAPDDRHYFQSLRIASASDQKSFDEIIQGLTKTLIDSINEKKLNYLIPDAKRGEIKGSISRLEYIVNHIEIDEYRAHIQFLRDLQDLRSSGSAHRKGSGYKKVAKKLGLVDTTFSAFSKCLFEKSIIYLKFMKVLVEAISAKAEIMKNEF